jgi:uncharacterized membrane protein YfcA
MDLVGVALIGIAAGVVAGMLGVGGGILFVPSLTLILGFAPVEAEATSLLAIIPVAIVGAWRQRRYGNADIRVGLWVGVLAVLGTVAGVVLANAVSGRTLEIGFAILLVFVAAQLVRRSLRPRPEAPDDPGRATAD